VFRKSGTRAATYDRQKHVRTL